MSTKCEIGDYIYTKNSEDWKRSKKKFFYLSPSTKEQIQLNALALRYNEYDKKREKKILQSHHKLKKREQTVERRSQLELKRERIYYIIYRVLSIETPNRYHKYSGVSVKNIMNARYDGHAFYYLRLEDWEPLVKECVRHLIKLNIIKEVSGIPKHEEPRYEFVETKWKFFVNEISEIIENDIMLRLNLVWKHLRLPTPQERLYLNGAGIDEVQMES